jgi:hypothetical protein
VRIGGGGRRRRVDGAYSARVHIYANGGEGSTHKGGVVGAATIGHDSIVEIEAVVVVY